MSIVEKAVSRMDPDRGKKRGIGVRGAGSVVDARADTKPGKMRSISGLELAALGGDPALAKQFRFLKRPVLARIFGRGTPRSDTGRLVMITSDLPQVGKSFVALNLAASIAQEQMTRMLLIDADPVRRTLTQQLDLQGEPGILDLISDPRISVDDVMVATDLPALQFIPAGSLCDNATELFASKRMTQIVAELDHPDRVMLLDTAPLLATSEARALAEKVDHTMIVIQAGRSMSAEIENMLKIVRETGSTVGFVLNKAPKFDTSRYQDYYPY